MKAALIIRFAVVVLLTTTSVFSQNKERTLQWAEIPLINRHAVVSSGTQAMDQIEVLEIKDITVAGKSITMGQPFAADDNWITSIIFRIKNISDKSFSSIQIDMILPEIIDGGPLIPLFYKGGEAGMGGAIRPGDEFEMKVVHQQWVTDQISSKSKPSLITKAQIHHISVNQSDGKKLISSCIRTADKKTACPTPAQ